MEEFYTFKVFKDGNQWCAIFLEHEDIAPPERCEGWGDTIREALKELIYNSGIERMSIKIEQQPKGPDSNG